VSGGSFAFAMKRVLTAQILANLALIPPPAHAALDAPCVADAIAKAGPLLRFHNDLKAGDPVDIEPDAKALPPLKAPKGKGSFDVLEVTGHYLKATYRMRFIYAQIRGSCALMGQEILEVGDPY
jgi:hypothetical protein